MYGELMDSDNERHFSIEEIITVIKKLDKNARDLNVREELLSYEGVVVQAVLRAPGSPFGYSYSLKGSYEQKKREQTTIDRFDYASPDSDDVVWSEHIGTYKKEGWIKV